MKATLTPFGENLILAAIAPKERTEGGIIIPTAHQSPVNQGTVLDKGPLCSDKIKEGDIVFFPMHSEHRMEWKGNKLILVPESACLGCISELKVPIS